jgi:hypothetical protein
VQERALSRGAPRDRRESPTCASRGVRGRPRSLAYYTRVGSSDAPVSGGRSAALICDVEPAWFSTAQVVFWKTPATNSFCAAHAKCPFSVAFSTTQERGRSSGLQPKPAQRRQRSPRFGGVCLARCLGRGPLVDSQVRAKDEGRTNCVLLSG